MQVGKGTLRIGWLIIKKYGYEHSNVNHPLFLKRYNGKLMALIIYVDDTIAINNNEGIWYERFGIKGDEIFDILHTQIKEITHHTIFLP